MTDASERDPEFGDSKIEPASGWTCGPGPGSTSITKRGKRLGSQKISVALAKDFTSASTCGRRLSGMEVVLSVIFTGSKWWSAPAEEAVEAG